MSHAEKDVGIGSLWSGRLLYPRFDDSELLAECSTDRASKHMVWYCIREHAVGRAYLGLEPARRRNADGCRRVGARSKCQGGVQVSFPTWMWLFFGAFGTAGAVLFTFVAWYFLKAYTLAQGSMRSAFKWNIVGLLFLFLGAWFACGVAGPPGNMLSRDPVMHDLSLATTLAALSIFLSIPGWACVLLGQRKMIQAIQ